ncbi:MAG: hypothetical protein KAJ09_00600, partial [Deltaproteobacteria bacterium]|nr:hypothetical protein [Deltaproteobacteria bacterium]
MRKMSEIRYIWVLALLVVFTVFLVAPDGAKAAEKFRLKWGHYLAAGPFLEVEQNFAKKIQER